MSKRKDTSQTESQKKSKHDAPAVPSTASTANASKQPDFNAPPSTASNANASKQTNATSSSNGSTSAFSSASSTANAIWKENTDLNICTGVTLTWKQNDTHCTIELKTSGDKTKLGSYDRNWFNIVDGYLVLSNTKNDKAPIFCRKLNDNINAIKGGSSYSGGSSGGKLKVEFSKKVSGTPVLAMFESQMNSDQQKEYDINIEKAKQHPLAFKAFLNQLKDENHFLIESVDMTNKSSYCNLTLTTNGGSIFVMKTRLGGIHIPEKDMVEMLQEYPSDSILQMVTPHEIGDMTYKETEIVCVAEGDDLIVTVDDFTINNDNWETWSMDRKKDLSLPQMGVVSFDFDITNLDDGSWLREQQSDY